MSLHKNTTHRLPVERSQAGETVTTNRLYPSLPNIDSYDLCVVDRSVEEKLHPAADYHPDGHQGDTQLEEATASSAVRMKARIVILEEQKQELLSINEKWAKEYRTMRQYFKEKTCDADVHCKLLKAEMEAKELRAQNSTLIRRGQHQHEEIRRLNKALEDSLQTTEPREVNSETLQQVWKHQADVYKEDFLKERKDREKLKEKSLEVEKRLRKVHSELRVLKSQVTRTPQAVLECNCTTQAKCPNWEIRQINPHHMVIQARYTLENKP